MLKSVLLATTLLFSTVALSEESTTIDEKFIKNHTCPKQVSQTDIETIQKNGYFPQFAYFADKRRAYVFGYNPVNEKVIVLKQEFDSDQDSTGHDAVVQCIDHVGRMPFGGVVLFATNAFKYLPFEKKFLDESNGNPNATPLPPAQQSPSTEQPEQKDTIE
jgi:hypothetical protein